MLTSQRLVLLNKGSVLDTARATLTTRIVKWRDSPFPLRPYFNLETDAMINPRWTALTLMVSVSVFADVPPEYWCCDPIQYEMDSWNKTPQEIQSEIDRGSIDNNQHIFREPLDAIHPDQSGDSAGE